MFREDSANSHGVEAAQASSDPLREAVWLAHELGHHQSRFAGFSPPVTPKPGETDQRLERVSEAYAGEVRAWLFACEILGGVKFGARDVFVELRAQGLRSYRDGLKLDEATAEALWRFRDSLDTRVAKGEFAPKTAFNI